jgi:hypothetical protein
MFRMRRKPSARGGGELWLAEEGGRVPVLVHETGDGSCDNDEDVYRFLHTK